MLSDWEKKHPSRIESIFSALQNIAPSQLADTQLFDFCTMGLDRTEKRKEYEHADSQTVMSRNINIMEHDESVQIIEFEP